MQNYFDIKVKLQSLDLILFKGPDWVSDTIRWCQRMRLGCGDFSHAGIIIKKDVLPNDNRILKDEVYILESTMSGPLASENVKNVDGKSYFGVQIRKFDDLVQSYDNNIKTKLAWCPLKEEYRQILEDDDLALKEELPKIIHKLEGTQYDANPVNLIAAILPCLRVCRKTADEILNSGEWLFCSEMCALVYKLVGLYPEHVKEMNVLPVDFLEGVDEDNVPTIHEKPNYFYYHEFKM